MAIPKTRTTPMDALEELSTDDVSLRNHRIDVIDHILAHPENCTPREWGVAHLYFKSGLSHSQIAWIFKTTRQSITASMTNLRKKAFL